MRFCFGVKIVSEITLQTDTEIFSCPLLAWNPSMKNSSSRVQTQEATAPEVETLSLGSSSVGSSLPDQGYIPSEGMAEGEDSGVISSPSDTQPTSPDGSLSMDGRIDSIGEKLVEPPRDSSSDSDEGCATWRSKHRYNGVTLFISSKLSASSFNQLLPFTHL